MELNEMGKAAKTSAFVLNRLGSGRKNEGLKLVSTALKDKDNIESIISANKKDIENAINNNMKASLVDRLSLNAQRINAMAEGIDQVITLDDPVGEVLNIKERPNGLRIGEKRVPLGVVGIIYESRPNVTADAFALCFKTGNSVILRGGSDAIESNRQIVNIIRNALSEAGLPKDSIQLIEDTRRSTAEEFMRLNEYVDVLIPRGGAGLIKTVVEKATIPVIETGTGNCHIYVDESADINMAANIIENAKTQRLGVCNACESLVIHSAIADKALPEIEKKLSAKGIEIRADERALAIMDKAVPASENDWGTEYLDAIISVKTVDSIDEAIAHINKYNTGHSESIITNDYNNSVKFLDEIDAAAVYVNASTRFTDGFEFGFGAEIGISTQKLHARGPMGLKALTTTKYIIYGSGQIRE